MVCKNLGAIGSGAAEGCRKTSLGDPKKLDFIIIIIIIIKERFNVAFSK